MLTNIATWEDDSLAFVAFTGTNLDMVVSTKQQEIWDLDATKAKRPGQYQSNRLLNFVKSIFVK